MTFKKVNFKKMGVKLQQRKVKKLRLLASEIIVGIINRTQSGKDVKNNQFKKYSKGYEKTKAKRFGSAKPNLTVTSLMLNAISSKDIPRGVRLFFLSAAENNKALFNEKTRKFFGVDKQQTKQIKKKLKRK